MLYVDTVGSLEKDIFLRKAAYACVRLNWSHTAGVNTHPDTADLYNGREKPADADLSEEVSDCHVLTYNMGWSGPTGF